MPSPSLVLSIDDDQLMLKYEKEFLEGFGHAVLTASSGAEGLKLASLHSVGIAILDSEMPGMSGADVAAEIRQIMPRALIIMLSGADVPAHAWSLADTFVEREHFGSRLLPTVAVLTAAL